METDAICLFGGRKPLIYILQMNKLVSPYVLGLFERLEWNPRGSKLCLPCLFLFRTIGASLPNYQTKEADTFCSSEDAIRGPKLIVTVGEGDPSTLSAPSQPPLIYQIGYGEQYNVSYSPESTTVTPKWSRSSYYLLIIAYGSHRAKGCQTPDIILCDTQLTRSFLLIDLIAIFSGFELYVSLQRREVGPN
ncbi:hypothetical protein ACMFMG_005832 [Clarireedia jacksonii]